MKPKYALHPCEITSQSDGDRHYISVGDLVKLYRLKKGTWVVWRKEWDMKAQGYKRDDYIHLYPKEDGDYRLPQEPYTWKSKRSALSV